MKKQGLKLDLNIPINGNDIREKSSYHMRPSRSTPNLKAEKSNSR